MNKNKFLTIFKFEYTNIIDGKSFKILTGIFVALIILLASIPTVIGLFSSKPEADAVPKNSTEIVESKSKEKKILLFDPENILDVSIFSQYIANSKIIQTENIATIEDDILNNVYEFALVIQNGNFDYYYKGNTMFDLMGSQISSMLNENNKQQFLQSKGLSIHEIDELNSQYIHVNNHPLGADLKNSYAIGYALIMVLYFAILMYGSLVSSSVITEKSSKAMELLTSSASPKELMFGKVFGVGFAGLTQLFTLITAFVIALAVSKASWLNMIPEIAASLEIAAQPHIYFYAAVYLMLGFFTYAFLFAAFSSTAEKIEDASIGNMIPTLLFVTVFMVAQALMLFPDSIFSIVLSFTPFFSPLIMFMRIAVSSVPFYQILISIVINVLGLYFIGTASAKLYRMGSLAYGNSLKIGKAVKIFFTSEKKLQ